VDWKEGWIRGRNLQQRRLGTGLNQYLSSNSNESARTRTHWLTRSHPQHPAGQMTSGKDVCIAILDDYQGVALASADWSSLQSRPGLSITVFRDTLQSESELAARLLPFNIICTMRERTKFPSSLLDRLPNLRLLTTTAMGNRAIDINESL
jgi:hypothetical protein